MKEKIINLKNVIIMCLVNLKDKLSTIISKNKKNVILIASVLIIVIGIVIAIMCIGNNDNVNINANLNNSGFVLKNKGWIFYLGFDEGQSDGVYKLKDNKKEKFIDEYVLYLNKSGKYIYYLDVENEDIVKIKTDGKDKKIVVEDVDLEKFIVIDNWIYYFDEAKFCRTKTNGKDKQVISEKSIENYEIKEDWIYYSYKNDGEYIIAKVKTNGEDNTKINEDAGVNFFIKGKYIYYIYENYNKENNQYTNELYKMKLNGKNKEKVADLDKEMYIASINYSDNEIYYFKRYEETKLAIYKKNLKSGEETKVVDLNGHATYINIIDNWIYYPDINEIGNEEIYRIKINGEDKEGLCK